MRIALTGATGFLGWHVRCRAMSRGLDCVPIRREATSDPDRLARVLRDVDAVVHCAGVTRGTDSAVIDGNLAAARALAAAVRRVERPIRIVYANSTHARGDSDYGAAKRKAAELLAGTVPGRFSDVVLPNLFGEHGRPYHNSFVATFCHDVAAGRRPADVRDREVRLLHAQDAAQLLIAEVHTAGDRAVEPEAEPVRVGAVLRLLTEFESTYRDGQLPDLAGRFRGQLFRTYRSHLFPQRFPVALPRRADARGTLVECVRAGTNGGQAFISTTRPGATRGDHVHLRKFERFVVVDGRAEIALRRLFTDRVVRYRVDGDRPSIVDIPTLWTHRLTNVGADRVTTFFWTDEVYRVEDADTFPCPVTGGQAPA